jgi:ABC-type transport system substrate-binding protein
MLRRANSLLSRSRFFVTSLLPYFVASLCLSSCSRSSHNDPSSLTFLIEYSPTNLDPRFATDSQSQRLDGLLFNGLLDRDNQMNFHGDLAESWETPNPLTSRPQLSGQHGHRVRWKMRH